jgi:hypothetical protein
MHAAYDSFVLRQQAKCGSRLRSLRQQLTSEGRAYAIARIKR